MKSWRLATTALPLDRTLVMGILNVTPDSFSDGGRFDSAREAVEAAEQMVAAGADVIDVGGESTRPGAAAVTADEEQARVGPVVEALVERDVIVSVDTSKAAVAAAVLAAGAQAINDVTALSDPGMATVVSRAQAGCVLMHMQGDPRTMQADPTYADVVGEVRDHLVAAAATAEAAGLAPDHIVIDPGIGFGKTVEHNLRLLAATDVLAATGYPVMVGASRKSFLGTVLDRAGLGPSQPADRDLASAAVAALAVARGAKLVRVHNVRQIKEVATVVDAIVAAEVSDG